MSWLPEQQVADYCMYEVVLGSGVRYSSRKPTGIWSFGFWTNIAGWVPRRCSCAEHGAAIGSKVAKKHPSFPELGICIDAKAAKRWTPEELHVHLDLMQAMRLD